MILVDAHAQFASLKVGWQHCDTGHSLLMSIFMVLLSFFPRDHETDVTSEDKNHRYESRLCGSSRRIAGAMLWACDRKGFGMWKCAKNIS